MNILKYLVIGFCCAKFSFARTLDGVFNCQSNQQWDGVQCVQCSDGCSCATSRLEGACDACLQGYQEYNPTNSTVVIGKMICLGCNPECGTECCFNYTNKSMVCQNCPDTYYLSAWFCSKCLDPNCQVCTNNGVCTTCKQGYFLNSISICQPCVGSNCSTCGSTGSCATCPYGYYADSATGDCLYCSSFGTMANGCLTCSSKNPAKCEICAKYHYLDGSGKCREVAFCDSIIAVGEVCTFCTDGYYQKSNGKCAICPMAGAARCSSPTTILQCDNDKAITSTLAYCVQRILHCITYLNSGLCSVCDSVYIWLSSGICYLTCNSAIPNCTTCVNGTSSTAATCSTCAPGYFASATSQNCYKCDNENNGGMKGCATCSFSGSFSCSVCQSGFLLNAGICVGCTPDGKGTGCSVCSSTTTCGTCLTNSFTQSGTCYACDVSCGGCTDYGYRNCLTTCSSDLYYLDNTTQCLKCKKNMPGCRHCTNKTTCTSCAPSYFLSSSASLVGTPNQCQLFQGCKIVNQGQSCTLCKPGYSYKFNGCVECQTQDCTIGCTNETNVIVIFSPHLNFSLLLSLLMWIML